jgi:Profilin
MAEGDGWLAWINSYIINHIESNGDCVYGICRRGAIYEAETGKKYGDINFDFLAYDLEIKDENDKVHTIKVNEYECFKTFWESDGKTIPYQGIRLNNEKFVLSNFDSDRQVAYMTGENKGACIAKSEKLFVIGIYYKTGEPLPCSSGKTKQYSAGNANCAVENCREKLLELGM